LPDALADALEACLGPREDRDVDAPRLGFVGSRSRGELDYDKVL